MQDLIEYIVLTDVICIIFVGGIVSIYVLRNINGVILTVGMQNVFQAHK